MLDVYTNGTVKRISPEAPVPVMEVSSRDTRPGGAGNVVLGLQALGAKVYAAGRVGEDALGKKLLALLEPADTSLIHREEEYETPVKNRLIAGGQQLIRIDQETLKSLSPSLEKRLIKDLEKILPQVQIVAISDYGKGFLSKALLQEVIERANALKIPSIVDPKGLDFTKYRGATLIKPNVSEAFLATKSPPHTPIDEVAEKLFSFTDTLVITRSEEGMSVFERGKSRFDYPANVHKVRDVTGAGDTVLAVFCLGLSCGFGVHFCAQLANIAASISVEKIGCAEVSLAEIAKRLVEGNPSKIYDGDYPYALRHAFEEEEYVLVTISSKKSSLVPLIQALRELAKEGKKIVLYAEQVRNEEVELLSSIREVDHIFTKEADLKSLSALTPPSATYTFSEEGLLREKKILKALLERAGDRVEDLYI